MKLTIESTSQVVDVDIAGGRTKARVWRGVSEGGVRCDLLVLALAVHESDDRGEFDRELRGMGRGAAFSQSRTVKL